MKRFICFFSLIALSLTTLMLASCSTVSPPATFHPSKNSPVSIAELDRWQINGKIGVQTAQDSGSASLNWVENKREYSIFLAGPLGANALKLTGRPGSVLLETADGKHFTAHSPEQLLAKKWRWDLPISNLYYWIRGLPVPGVPFTAKRGADNSLRELHQQGWEIQYLSYAPVGNLALPNRILLTSSMLKVKIMISQWQV